MLRAILVFVVATVSTLLLLTPPPSRASTEVLTGVDTGFESGTVGWSASGATLTAVASPPPHSGVSAGRVAATGTSTVALATQYWLAPTTAGVPHTLNIWVLDNDSRITLSVELTFHNASGTALLLPSATTLSGDSVSYRLVTVSSVQSPPGTVYVKATVRGTPTASGATFYVDDASITREDPPPTPAPTPTPTPTATPTPEATASPTSTPTTTATVAPTAAPTAVNPFATAPAGAVYPALINGNFEHPATFTGWNNVGGSIVPATPGLNGSARGAMLISDTDSTKWLQQAVTVEADRWYAASATVLPRSHASAAWLRIAWYASTSGDGSQLATVDSNLASTIEAAASVTTGPVRAPAEARSARIRLMLRPLNAETAILVADDVRFEVTDPPAATPTPRPIPTPAASSQPTASVPTAIAAAAPTAVVPQPSLASTPQPAQPRANAGSAGAVAPVPTAQSAPARSTPDRAGTPLLRITEFLADPVEPGIDADYEWIEVANLGTEPANLDGVFLGDNQSAIALPALTLGPRQLLVIAGARAAVPEASSYRPAEGFSNGLANGGDRLALFLTDGTILDALSYGSDTTYDRPPLPAPAAGKSLVRRFADDATFASHEVRANPSPGVLDPVIPPRASTTEAAATAPREIDPLAWAALGLVGVGTLGAVAVQRYRVLRTRRG